MYSQVKGPGDELIVVLKKMDERALLKPVIPQLPVPRFVTPLAGFPVRLVGYQSVPSAASRPLVASRERTKAQVTILPELCKGCELCILACPSGNLSLSPELNRNGYHPVVFSYEGTRGPCSACGLCYWACPDFAVSEIRRLRP